MAHQKSFGSGQSKTVRSLRASQALPHGVWTAVLSSVTCATVLGVPSVLGSMNLRNGIAIAQTATPSVSPALLPPGSGLTIEGSGSLAAVNQVLKEKFEGKHQKTPVTFNGNGTKAGLEALTSGKADLAAIGRSLTPEEKAQGFIAIPVKREKIALLVSEENPFRGSLTIQQFAKIFRGEITNWSEVSGPDRAIRVVDQPEASDTRKAFPNYPVFKAAPFQAAAGAVQVGSEAPDAIAATLGVDGLGYVTADGVKNLKGVRALDLHKTQPSDPLYPFSQPIAYVYKKGSLSIAAQAFLGYLGTDEAKLAIESVSLPSAVIGNSAVLIATAIAIATPSNAALAASPPAPPSANVGLTPATASGGSAVGNKDSSLNGGPAWWPWILGLGLIGLVWWLLKDKGNNSASSSSTEPIVDPTESSPTALDSVVPATAAPPTEATNNAMTSGSAATVAASTAALLIDPNPRSSEPTMSVNPVDDDCVVAVDHDVATHGLGTAQVNPRDSAGNSGGLKFPAIDPVINPVDIAIAGVAGIGAAGMAGQPDGSEESIATVDPVPSPVLAVTLPHEPVTQLPPDTYTPSDSTITPMNPGEIAAGIGAAALGNTIAILTPDQLADVDRDLPDLASGYGESRIILMPRDPQWAYAYWDIPNEHRQSVRYLGGEQLALRLYDVTDLDLNKANPHSVQQYACDELARAWYLPIPVSDRDYIAEIGYVTSSGEWLLLARSNRISIPPVYPSDWMDDRSITVDWEEPLQGKTFSQLVSPGSDTPEANETFHQQIFNLAYGVDPESRVSGSLFGPIHQSSSESLSSFVFPAGAGLWAKDVIGSTLLSSGLTPSGIGMSGVGMSGIGMSGIGLSGVGIGLSVPPDRSRQFWLVADAELIVYGATEPDAQLTIGGVPVQLSPDGTFRIQLSFQDGRLDFPIMAIAKDGQQMRQIRMTFDRTTPSLDNPSSDRL